MDKSFIKILADDDFMVTFTRKGKDYTRKYAKNMHRNNTMKRFWADFGYWKKDGTFVRLWNKQGTEPDPIMKALDRRFQSHIDIMTDEVRIYKVKQSILDDSCMPVCLADDEKTTFPLPYLGDETYKYIGISKYKEFNMIVEARDGNRYVTSKECFVRTYPLYWLRTSKEIKL